MSSIALEYEYNKKDARMDLRMSTKLKQLIEEAASLEGMSVSQWAIDRLATCARADIADSRRTLLEDEAFDALSAALDESPDAVFAAFAARKSVWEQ